MGVICAQKYGVRIRRNINSGEETIVSTAVYDVLPTSARGRYLASHSNLVRSEFNPPNTVVPESVKGRFRYSCPEMDKLV
jgi:hypothetical protein